MYLKKVEICGFKSFPEKTDIEFGPGVTAVVGPNGCGKTNLSDAIRWVLGEQSARQLRGRTMEDVIFNGSEDRKPLGMAEVSLTIGGTANLLPVPYDEICITRRVFRSGESDYLLNRKPCRLKDIKDLFLDTGVGSDTYSMIERDMIDGVLDERSGARRAFIEEAAGIAKYKDREIAARRKLELTDQDLVRLSDVILELEKRVRSLQYQMGKARRYKRLTESLRVMEAARAASDIRKRKERLAEIDRDLGEIKARREAGQAALAEKEAELENLSLRRVEFERELAQAQEALNEAEKRTEAMEAESLVLRERQKGTRALLLRAGEEKASLEQQFNRIQSEREDASLALVTLEGRRGARRGEHETLKAEVAELEAERERWRSALNEKRGESLQVFENRVRRSNELGTLGKNLEKLLDEKNRILRQVSDVAVRMEEMGTDLASLDQETERLDREMGRLETKRTRVEDGRKKHEARLSEIHSRSVSLESKLGSLEEKLGLLKGLEENLEGYESGVKTVLSDRKTEVEGIVADLVTAKQPEHETAVEAALSDSLQLVVTSKLETACQLVEYLRTAEGGVAGFLALEALEDVDTDGVPADLWERRGVLGKVAEHVACDGSVRPVVDYLLGRTVLTETLDAALGLSQEPRYQGLTFVTLEGDAVSMPGRLFGGRRSGGDLSVVGRRGEIAKAEDQTTEIRMLLDEIRDFEAKALRVRERLSQISDLLTETLGRTREEHLGCRQQRSVLDAELVQCERSREMFSGQLERLHVEIRQIDRDREQAVLDVSRLSDEESEAANLTEMLEQKVQGWETAYREKTARLSALETEIAALDDEEARLRSRAADLMKQSSEAEHQIAERTRDTQNAEMEIRRCEESLAGMADDLKVASEKVEARRASRDRLREGGASFRDREAALKQEIREHAREKEHLGERIHQTEMEVARLEAEENSIRDQIREKYEMDLEDIEIPADTGEVGPEDVEEIRRKIKGLGPVNLVALEEYEQERERLDFLTSQRDDLETAKESLKQTIVEIHHTARKRFKESFEIVRVKFIETFASLFEDGEADLRLEDPHDPLRSGIAIIARPKGKLERHISLLSGGERSLTAIAFLVSLYLVKPSAFCILDEIDAALDDANVLKFASLLRRLKEKTQFVMITHNKRSMEIADCLYGVTMSEPGVSRIVSVDLRTRAA